MLALTFILAALSMRVSALNDWTVPCTNGKCSYDWVGDANTKAFSSLSLDGSRQLLSDITQAAGWKVMDCNPDWEDGPHDIRLVCDGTPEQTALCQHVYENGAENMVVRLPQNCGVGPFARVSKTWEPTNQTIPDHIKRELSSRATQVRGMTLDYDFKSVPESKGKLNFAISSSNAAHPTISRRHNDLYRRGRDRYLHRRGLFGDIGSAITSAAKDAATAVTDGAKDAATAVSSVATEAASAVSSVATEATSVAKDGASVVSTAATKGASAVSSVATKAASAVTDAGKAVATKAVDTANKVKNATSFNETETGKEIPIKFDKNITLLDTDINCVNFKNDITAHVHLDVDAHMDAQIKYGYTLVGSVVPFKLDDMAVFASLSGTSNMTFGLGLEATGTLDTFPIQIVKFGLPGLSIPGIAALGPELALDARLKMDLDVAAQMQINADFDLGNVNMVFPDNKGNSSATSKSVPNQNTIKLSTANGGTDFSGTVQALLIPRFDFGVDLKVVQASVFLKMEVGAEMEMKGSGGNGAPDAQAEANEDDGTDDGTEDDTDATDDGTEDDTDATDDATDDSADDSTAADDATDDSTAADDGTDDSTATDDATDDSTAADDTGDAAADDTTDDTGDNTADDASADDSSSDNATADDTSADDTSADDTSADDTSADDTSADDSSADDSSADDTSADDTSAEDTSADDTSADDTSADDTSADDTSADDTSAGDTSADDTSADDTSADDTSADDTSADDAAADDTSADDATADDTSADDTSADDTSAGDTSDDTATDDTATDGTDDATGTDDSTAEDDTGDDAAADDGTDDTEDDTATDDSTVDDTSATNSSKPLNGCVRVKGVMDISFGLQGTIEPLFPQQVAIPLFNTSKELLTKCFGGATADILDELEQEEAADESGLADDDSSTEDDTSDDTDDTSTDDASADDSTGDDASTEDDTAAADDASADDTSDAATRKKRSSLTIRQRRHLASLQRRESLEDAISQAVPQLASTAVNALVCPGSFFPFSALSALPI